MHYSENFLERCSCQLHSEKKKGRLKKINVYAVIENGHCLQCPAVVAKANLCIPCLILCSYLFRVFGKYAIVEYVYNRTATFVKNPGSRHKNCLRLS